ncbi:MAG: methyltransferase domain-containing protein [Chloroflexota bacterium]|nr:methyltransferase domain-containing protein [Chloroflexota bacterium]
MTGEKNVEPGVRLLERLRADVEAIGSMVRRVVDLPWSGRSYAVVMPADIDPLLDRVVDDSEQNLPYWAELWPSGVALADRIERNPEALYGRRVIELGCGLGVTAVAALRAGADLVAADYAAEALALCRLNTHVNSGLLPETVSMNWRAGKAALPAGWDGGFDVVLAADVLYERRDVAPLTDLMWKLLVPGGRVWLAEPARAVAADFLASTRGLGWQWQTEHHPGPWPDAADHGVSVGIHQALPGPYRNTKNQSPTRRRMTTRTTTPRASGDSSRCDADGSGYSATSEMNVESRYSA